MEIRFTVPASANEVFMHQFLQEAETMLRRKIEAEQKPMSQKELMKHFGFNKSYLDMLVRKGLRRRKQGKYWKYDLKDVYETLELLKE